MNASLYSCLFEPLEDYRDIPGPLAVSAFRSNLNREA
jgi:hypothetical protein